MFVELFSMSNQNTLLRLRTVTVYTRNARRAIPDHQSQSRYFDFAQQPHTHGMLARAIPDIILARKETTLNSEPI